MNINEYLDYYTYKEIVDLSYYLVLLFYKTDCKYSCHRTKINRLLTIFILCNLKNKPNLKDSKFYIQEHFMGLSEINNILDRDIYYRFNYDADSIKEEITEEFIEPKNIPERYKKYIDNIELTDETKELLEIIFRKFGSYSINDLAPSLDQLKEFLVDNNNYSKDPININVENFIDFINLNEIKKRYKDNEIFNFIKDYHNNKKVSKPNKEKLEEAKIKLETYNKLVRDKIPEIIENKGNKTISRNIPNNIEFKKELMNNLLNDYNQLNNIDKDAYLEKLSDIVEIIRQLAELEYSSLDYLITLADINTRKYGSFNDRIYLERVLKKEK